MGLGNLLWKRAFTRLEGELNRRGYTTNTRDDPTRDSPERRVIRIVCHENVVDLYIRNGYWTIDAWVNIADGWHHSNISEVVEDRYRLGAGITKLDSGTPQDLIIDTLIYNFVLPEFGPGISPHPTASRIPGTRPGPAASLPAQTVARPLPPAPQQAFAATGIDYADEDGDGDGDGDGVDYDYLNAYRFEGDEDEDDEDYEEEPEEEEDPVQAGLSPSEAKGNLQLILWSYSSLHSYDDASHLPEIIAAWGASYDPGGRRTDGYLIAAGPRIGFFRPEALRKTASESPDPLVFQVADCEVVGLGKPYGISLNVPGNMAIEDNRLGLFTLQLRTGSAEELNLSVEYGQYDASGKTQVINFMEVLLERIA